MAARGLTLVVAWAMATASLAQASGKPDLAELSGESVSKAAEAVIPGVIDNEELRREALGLFGLNAGTLIDIDLPDEIGNGFVTVIPVEGDTWTLDLQPHSLLTENYQLLVQIEGGAIIPQAPSPIRTIRGVAAEMNGSVFAGSLLEEGLTGVLSLSDGRRYWIEPVGEKIAGIARSLHILYQSTDVIPSGGSCANDAIAPPSDETAPGPPRGSACGTGLCFAELATDADFEYYQSRGSSVTNVENRIQLVVNTFNVEYERDVQITHVISTIVVRTDSNDPYTSTDSDTLVSQVRSEWNTHFAGVQRDLTQLFTGRDIDGSIIGQAYNIGIVCTTSAYSYAQSDCCGSLACSSDLHAHENGHVWGGFHCNPCENTTMHTPLQCASVFAAINIGQITTHRDSRTCLSTAGTTPLPFFDDFPTTSFDTQKWGNVGGATIETTGLNPPSSPNSLNVDGTDTITTNIINAINAANGSISFYWQRRGGGNSPETGDDLIVEYLNNTNDWVNLVTYPGSGPDQTTFTLATFAFPADGIHSFFRLRFRNTSTQANTDDYYIDDVYIDAGDVTPPTPNPMTFSITPRPEPSNELLEMKMEASAASDANGPVEYYFERITGAPGGVSGWQSSRAWNSAVTIANAPWSFRVKARDAAPNPNETNWSSPFTGYTGIETPTGVTTSNIGGDRLDLTALGSFSSLNQESTGLYFEVLDEQSQPVGNGSNAWTQNSSATTVAVTGLEPETQYTVRVKARNREARETAFTAPVNFTTTDLVTPGAPILSNAEAESLLLQIDANNNPVGTQYAVQCASTSPLDPNWDGIYLNQASGMPNGATEDWQTINAPIQVIGLQTGTTYTFHVKARNPALTESQFGPTAALATVALNTPTAPAIASPTTTTLDLTLGTNGNAGTTQYAIRCAATLPLDSAWQGFFVHHATGTPNGATADWQAASGVIHLVGLKPNTRYTFEVKARPSSGGSESPYGPTANLATLALAPAAPIVGVFPQITAELDVVRDSDPVLDNPSDTTFAIFCVSANPADVTWSGQYVGSTGSAFTSPVWRTDGQWGNVVVQNLRSDTAYVFAVSARNRDLVETAFGASAQVVTGTDCNVNGINDVQELAECMGAPSCSDCNGNSTIDQCEVGFSAWQGATIVTGFSSAYDLILPAYAADQLLGEPNVAVYGDSQNAWAPLNADDGVEFVEVQYDQPVLAQAVRIRENLNNGFVTRIELVKNDDDSLVEVWPLATGETDTTPPGQLADFTVAFTETAYLVKGVRVTINTTTTLGDYEEIDAIQLLGRIEGVTADDNANGVPDSCEIVEAPNAPQLSNPNYTSMDISIAPDGNPAGAEYALRCTGSTPADPTWDGQFVTASGSPAAAEDWRTATAWGTTTLVNLQPGTAYSFNAKTRGVVGVESPFGPTGSLSTIPLPTGACCANDGSCSTLTNGDCATAGGNYQGDGVSCDPNPCPQPMGACCFIDGSCSVTTAADCTSNAGAYQGDDTPCDPNPCPQPTGACCVGDGACSILTETNCLGAAGLYQGDDTLCDPNPCPQPCSLLGDVNDDGLVDGGDIAGFMRVRLDIAPEPGEKPACADFGNGNLELDIADFVTVLIGA